MSASPEPPNHGGQPPAACAASHVLTQTCARTPANPQQMVDKCMHDIAQHRLRQPCVIPVRQLTAFNTNGHHVHTAEHSTGSFLHLRGPKCPVRKSLPHTMTLTEQKHCAYLLVNCLPVEEAVTLAGYLGAGEGGGGGSTASSNDHER